LDWGLDLAIVILSQEKIKWGAHALLNR